MVKDLQGHVRQRKDGRWEGQYIFQTHRRSIYATTEFEVHRKLKEVIVSIKEGRYTKPNEHTVFSWLNEWLDTYAQYSIRPTTYMNYRLYVDRHFIPAFGTLRIENVSVETLQKFFNDKMQGGRLDEKHGGLSIKTLKSMKHMLNVAFSQAYFSRTISFNPVSGVKLPIPEYHEQRVLSEGDNQTLLDLSSVCEDMIAKGIIVLLNCGLRKGELLDLLWENVNFDKDFIRIKYTLSRLTNFKINSNTQGFIRIDTYSPIGNKTGIYLGPVKTQKSNRTIFLPHSVKKALSDIWKIQERYRVESKCNLFNPHGFVFCNRQGRPYGLEKFEVDFQRFLEEAQVNEINVHATRHTFATSALAKTTDFIAVSEIMEHAVPSTTLDMYGHTFDSRKRALMSAFD